jgi:hypothetical protein
MKIWQRNKQIDLWMLRRSKSISVGFSEIDLFQ